MQVISTLSLVALLATAQCSNVTNSSTIAPTPYTNYNNGSVTASPSTTSNGFPFSYWGKKNTSTVDIATEPAPTFTDISNNATINNGTQNNGTQSNSTQTPNNNGTSSASSTLAPIVPPTATPSSYDIIAPNGCRGGTQKDSGFTFNLYEINPSLFDVSKSDTFINAVLAQSPIKQSSGSSFQTVKSDASELSSEYVAVELNGYFVPGTDVSYKFTSYSSVYSSLQIGSNGKCFQSSSVTSNTNKADNLGPLLKRSENVLGLRGFFDNTQTYPIRFVAVFDRSSDFNGFSISNDDNVDLSLNNIKQYYLASEPFSSISETSGNNGPATGGTVTTSQDSTITSTKSATATGTATESRHRQSANFNIDEHSSKATNSISEIFMPSSSANGNGNAGTQSKSTSDNEHFTKSVSSGQIAKSSGSNTAGSNSKASSSTSSSSSASSSVFTNGGTTTKLSASSLFLALSIVYFL